MKKFIYSCILICALSSITIAQEQKIKNNIQWHQNETIFIDSTRQIHRLSFFDALHYEGNQLPYQLKKVNIENGTVTSVKLIPIEVEPFPNENLKGISGVKDIPNEFKVNVQHTEIRKKSYAYFEVLPIRKNAETNQFEILKSYELSYTISEKVKTKTQKRDYTTISKLANGKWYKFRVAQSGVYELPYSTVAGLGFSNPGNIGVFGYGGMVPKLNADARHDDLPERPVYLKDNNGNSVFDAGDALLVYLEGPNTHKYDTATQSYVHQMHNYSDYSYYFLSDNSEQKRISTVSEYIEPTYTTSTYDFYTTMEKDSFNIAHSGRTLYWRLFDYTTSYNFNFSVPNRIAGENAKITIDLATASVGTPSKFKASLNGNETYINTGIINGAYEGPYASTEKIELTTPINTSNSLKIDFIKGNTKAKGWLNYITINVKANLVLNGSQLQFRDRNIGTNQVTQYNISGCNNSTMIWDVSHPVNVFAIEKDNLSDNTLSFSAAGSEIREFVAINPNANFPQPQLTGDEIGFISNQNLHGTPQVDYIIITYADFKPYAEELGELHQEEDGFSYIVTTPQKIYNEFSSGTTDISAIRDFIKMFYDRADTEANMPRNVLLFGDGSYDNRAVPGENENFIPTYQTVTSLKANSFTSDDFYVLLDDSEGTVNGHESMDIGIGRLPVKSTEEAQAAINKIRHYISPESFGNWKNDITLVGDDEDGGEHQNQANQFGDTIIKNYKNFNVDKLLLDAYTQISTVQGAKYPEVNQEINEKISKGTLIFNYSGHGSSSGLAHENIVTISQINTWKNLNNLPFFVTATCQFARYDDYGKTSAGEKVFLNPQGGGIGLFTTSRLVYPGDNRKINLTFFNYAFNRDAENRALTLGEIIRLTKNNVNSNQNNKRNFTLLGDPAVRLSTPDYLVVTDSINGKDNLTVDTIGAASLVKVHGHISDRNGNTLNNFNGLIYPTVYDKIMDYITLGNDPNTPQLSFQEQSNILYSGKTKVNNGYFSFEFIVPIDIAYFNGNGKISYYANSETHDAHGYFDNFIIGGSSENINSDTKGPEIELYINNENFINGDITDENPKMLAKLWDESGINTVGNGIGHDMIAVLDDNSSNSIVLNDFYEADLGSYQSGAVKYPFFNLGTGLHRLRLKAWDVFNNSSEKEINFIVANSSELVIEQVLCYPNPMIDYTNFQFNHNHPNENLDIEISIYNTNGQKIRTINEKVYSTGYKTEPIRWNADTENGGKIERGIYIYNIKITAENGDIVNKSKKLVVVK